MQCTHEVPKTEASANEPCTPSGMLCIGAYSGVPMVTTLAGLLQSYNQEDTVSSSLVRMRQIGRTVLSSRHRWRCLSRQSLGPM